MKQIKNWRPLVVVAIAVVALMSIVFIGGALDKNASGPIGYVDIYRLSAEFKPIADIQKEIDNETKKFQDKFDVETKGFKDEDKAKQELFEKYQIDLNKRISELKLDEKLQVAQNQLFNTIAKIAEEKGLSTVIDAGVVYYGNPALDVTDAVLAAGAKIK